jgi:hypothetical protein
VGLCEDQVALVVEQHLQRVSVFSICQLGAAHLLWALLVDVLEGVLCLLVVFPQQICEFRQLARPRVYFLLDSVNAIDIIFPRALGWTPFLVFFHALRRRCRCSRLGFVCARGSPLALSRALGFWSTAEFVKVFVHDVDGTCPALVSSLRLCVRYVFNVHVGFRLPCLILGVVIALPLYVEHQLALVLSVLRLQHAGGIITHLNELVTHNPLDDISAQVSAPFRSDAVQCAHSSSASSWSSLSSTSSTGFACLVVSPFLTGGISSSPEDSWSLSAAKA